MVERGEKGRLKKGSVLNPNGRPPKEKEHEYMDIMLSVVTTKRWRAIVTKAADQAERGDAVARKWLTDYIIGAPVQKMEMNADNPLQVIVEYINAPYPTASVPSGASGDTPQPEEV